MRSVQQRSATGACALYVKRRRVLGVKIIVAIMPGKPPGLAHIRAAAERAEAIAEAKAAIAARVRLAQAGVTRRKGGRPPKAERAGDT